MVKSALLKWSTDWVDLSPIPGSICIFNFYWLFLKMIIKDEHIGGDFRSSGCSETCPLWLPAALRGRPRPGGQQQACVFSPMIWKWQDNVLIKCNIWKITEKNGKRISYQLFCEFKLSVRKSGSHQDLVLLTADWKYRKKHSSKLLCYRKSGLLLSALSFLCLFYTYNEPCPGLGHHWFEDLF